MISITTVQSEADVLALAALQQENLRQNVPIDEQISDGFVSIQHKPDLLWRMNKAAPTIIAKSSNSELVGYSLTMLPEFARDVPDLQTLFTLIERVQYKGKYLQDYHYYVQGQVCVKKQFRGQKIFQNMLYKHRELYSNRYEMMITCISSKNNPSLRAHAAVGFKDIHSYTDPIINETWHILLWDWRE